MLVRRRQQQQHDVPLGALAPGAHGGDGQRVVLALHVHQVVDGLLAGEHVLLAQDLAHDQVGQGHHLGKRDIDTETEREREGGRETEREREREGERQRDRQRERGRKREM